MPPSGMCGSVFKGGGRQVSTAETGDRGSRPGELHRRRVVLLAESAGLAAVLNHLLDPTDRLSRIGSLRELAESRASTAPTWSCSTCRSRTAPTPPSRRSAGASWGRLVVLVAKGDKGGGLHLDDAATLLSRPFSAEELGAALAVPGLDAATAARPEADRRHPPVEIGTARPLPAALAGPAARGRRGRPQGGGQAGPGPGPVRRPRRGQLDLIDRVQRLLITLTEGWQARRRVRVAGFSVFALVAFTVAFALASQGRCGPGCDAFGTVFSPMPTVAPASSLAPSTTGPKRSTTTTAGHPGTGAFGGISGGRLATTTTERRATTTTGPATSRPGPPRPPDPDDRRPRPNRPRPPTTAPPTTPAPPVDHRRPRAKSRDLTPRRAGAGRGGWDDLRHLADRGYGKWY